MNPSKPSSIEHWCPGVSCCDPIWEEAYQRFESPAEEIAKFQKRLKAFGVLNWANDADIAELFCGRGNGLTALESFGFKSLHGVDLSLNLLQAYRGKARLFVGDCRELKWPDRSMDIIVVQGGLHHLPNLPGDLEKTFSEVRRVLRDSGRFVLVEPWNTPFLRIVHGACRVSILRKFWKKLDALATMIERERVTYEQWLGRPDEILCLLHKYFQPEREKFAWGKLDFMGRPIRSSR